MRHHLLTLFVRFCFVVMCTIAANAYGTNYFEATGFPVWLASVLGFAIAVTLIAVEQAFRRRLPAR